MNTSTVQALGEGKTKLLLPVEGAENSLDLQAKEDITAGDGLKHDILNGKAAFATRTTCNVFRLLAASGIPVAFEKQVDAITFRAPKCKMLDYEVVVRREAHGSFLHRYPHLKQGTYFPQLVLEIFAKTKDKNWRGKEILMDDPLLAFGEKEVQFFLPHFNEDQKKESAASGHKGYLVGQKPFMVVPKEEFYRLQHLDEETLLNDMGKIAKRVFLILEKAWQLLGRRLVDFKVEFGIDSEGRLLLADVIDSDSWRLVKDGAYQDKQLYRDGASLDKVLEKYATAAALSDQFGLPKQGVLVWSGSKNDDVSAIRKALTDVLGPWPIGAESLQTVIFHARSAHKQPMTAIPELDAFLQETPNSVVIANIGLSDGAGPTFSANTTCPVVAIPATADQCLEDVWSSLRLPSDVPLMTVLKPANAVLAALNILSANNPYLYAVLRERIEQRLVNMVKV